MALDWHAWRRARGSDVARQGLHKRPFPARSWQALCATPVSKLSWPYSDAETQCIGATLPAEHRSHALEIVVRAAQLYVFEQLRAHQGKPNPRKEIEQLRDALTGLFDALKNLSSEARDYLRSKMRPWRLPDEEPFTVESLRHAIDRFDHENRVGLTQLPASVRGGPT
jgi:hypothetical protein